ncbi:hypothetical protein [Bacillus toyonensis]|uniref:hypothetical protein n=1 Tax=Bacillus toyonensis TaxID=155322 RepID=UPI001C0DA235|nr:hypothetical protein [Bacillus toyonensis]MBU4643165.1 hypothetical protein [Bacillus toyonensis]
MDLLKESYVESPKEKMLQLIAAEGIEVEESFNLSVESPFCGGYLKERLFYSFSNEEDRKGIFIQPKSIFSIVVPKFTDLTEKEQAIDLSFVLALIRLLKEKRWTNIFARDSYAVASFAWKRAEKICMEEGIISNPKKIFGMSFFKDEIFKERKKQSLHESLEPCLFFLKRVMNLCKLLLATYISSWSIALFIWTLHSSGAIAYFPFLNDERFARQTLEGQQIAGFANSFFLLLFSLYIVIFIFKSLVYSMKR